MIGKNLLKKLKESLGAVLPITIIVLILSLCVSPMSVSAYILFGICAIMMLFGISLFTLGTDSSMSIMGESIGKSLCKSKKLSLMLICSAFIGFIITFAEPDLAVLAKQIADMGIYSQQYMFIAVVSIGVGIFLVVAILKVVFRIKLSIILAIGYTILFALTPLVPNYLVPIIFDSGSVTTGPISVPFLISFGLGIASITHSNDNTSDALGYLALSSLGPILATMIFGLFLPKNIDIIVATETVTMGGDVAKTLFLTLAEYLKDVAITILPIVLIFTIFQFTMLKLSKQTIKKIVMGLIYMYIGVVIFLTGVNAGFLPVASMLGRQIASSDFSWILLPLSLLLGYFIIAAEPAVHVLKKQVEEVTNGKIKQKTILIAVSIGVALSVFMAMLKTLYNIPLLAFLIPIYAICIGLSFYNSQVFTSIAFDAGGTATGAMAVSFILPFINGVAGVVAPGVATGFGTVAIIAVMPILCLQVLGAAYTIANKKHGHHKKKTATSHIEIIEFE